MTQTKHHDVQEYYGETLEKSEDLKTNACCTAVAPPPHIKAALANIHDEVMAKYYGCGLTIPDQVEGLRILDLGCGSGRDVYLAAQLVGPSGHVVGLDMTASQLDVARRHIDYHTQQFGYAEPNVSFVSGNIDRLEACGLELGSFDLIVSNCVINLVDNKAKVLADAYRLLKQGGEMYFSDVYCDRRVPSHLQEDKVLWGECLSGALYWNDFLRTAKSAGFTDPRVVSAAPITIENEALEAKVGDLSFYSVTYRLWKIDGLESDCEDYGQAVAYKGGIAHAEHALVLDGHHVFAKGKIEPVCGNTYLMLEQSRYANYFDFYGSWDTHYGIFEGCGGAMPWAASGSNDVATGSCC